MIILFAFLTKEEMLIRVLIFIFCGLFAVASGIILVYQLFFFVAVDENFFYRYYLFGFFKVEIGKIERVLNQDGFYHVVVKGKKVGTFAGNTKEGQQLIVFLERKGVKIDW